MYGFLRWVQRWGLSLATLLLVAFGVYFAWHTDSMESRDRARKPQLRLQFDHGEAPAVVFAEYPNGLKRPQAHGDFIVLNSGNRPATTVLVAVYAPRALGTPMPGMPGVGEQIEFRLDEASSDFVGTVRPQVPLLPRVPYLAGRFNFAADPGTYDLSYAVTCAECEEEARGTLRLTIAPPIATPAHRR
jgi:hypothetical protein